MKRFLICLLTVALLLGMMSVGTLAADYESDEDAWKNVQLHALYVQEGDGIMSDFSEDYYELWWYGTPPETEVEATASTVNMRGFSVSHDGRYAYMGTLNGGTGVRGVVVLDMMTGKITDLYYHYDGNNGVPHPDVPFSFAKGIAADERGYVYAGFAYSENYNVVNLGIAQQKEDGTLEHASYTTVCEFGTPGDKTGKKVGVNGVDVATIGDKTYCYVMVNYDYDALYCFDVTDPKAPVLNEEFGTDGYINFADGQVAGDGFTLKEGQYMDIAADGTIYLCADANEGKNGIMVIAPDGSECNTVIEHTGIYSVELVGDFMLCGLKDGSAINVLYRESGEQVTSIPVTSTYGDRVVRMQVVKDVLFVANPGSDAVAGNAILTASLSDTGKAFIDDIIASLNEPAAEDTDGETTAADTDAIGETTATADDSSADTTAADTTVAAAGETTAAATNDGCASVLVPSGALLLLAAAAYVCRKKD